MRGNRPEERRVVLLAAVDAIGAERAHAASGSPTGRKPGRSRLVAPFRAAPCRWCSRCDDEQPSDRVSEADVLERVRTRHELPGIAPCCQAKTSKSGNVDSRASAMPPGRVGYTARAAEVERSHNGKFGSAVLAPLTKTAAPASHTGIQPAEAPASTSFTY